MKLIFYIKTTDVGETKKKYSNNTSVDLNTLCYQNQTHHHLLLLLP